MILNKTLSVEHNLNILRFNVVLKPRQKNNEDTQYETSELQTFVQKFFALFVRVKLAELELILFSIYDK